MQDLEKKGSTVCMSLISISLTLFKGVEAIRDELAQVPPFQDWIPQGDVFPEEETCSTN